jgi:hypothetical protein
LKKQGPYGKNKSEIFFEEENKFLLVRIAISERDIEGTPKPPKGSLGALNW